MPLRVVEQWKTRPEGDGSRARRKLVVLGQGYVGLPLALAAAGQGYDVVGYDTDKMRVDSLMAGRSFIEDVSDEDLAHAIEADRYHSSTSAWSCAGFDVAVITVPTPLRDGLPDLSYVKSAARTLAAFVEPGALVVLESTTYPGTTEEVVAPILEKGSGLIAGTDFLLGYSPERIDPGNSHFPFEETPKVVSGIGEGSLKAVDAFYSGIVSRTVAVSSPKVAELAKLIENTFRHVNIALVNELAVDAHDLGIDIWEAIDAASSKPYGYMRFTPGPGVGGHCLPIDPSYLSWRISRSLGRTFRFVDLANDINSHMPEYVVQRIQASLNRHRMALNGARVLLLGLTYKKNTHDARESPALTISTRLLESGAEVRACDPHIFAGEPDDRITMVDLTRGELERTDVVIILTDHDDFDYDLVAEESRFIFDTRHRVEGINVEYL
jgi:UDP-N-acetyl-D-glucosamine dehydrogenase